MVPFRLFFTKGFFILIVLLLFAGLYSYKSPVKWGKVYGKVHLRGEVINTIYRKALFLDEEGRRFSFYFPKGVTLYPGDGIELEGIARGSYIKVERLKVKRNFLQRWRIKIHNYLKYRFLKTAETPFEKKLGSALLFGENWFSRSERAKLGHTGIYHIIVISGMHYALLFTFFLIFPVRWRLRYWLALGFFIFFTFFILFPKAPAYRAFISFAIFLLAKLFDRQYHSLKALLLAAALWLFLFPHWFYNIGFWLSYLASLALILYYGSQKTPEENFVRNVAGKLLGLEAALVVMSVINPILAYYFHYFSFGSFFYTWIFTLLAEGFLIVGILNMLTLWSFPPLLEVQHYIASAFGEVFYNLPEGVYFEVPDYPKGFMYLLVILPLLVLLVAPPRYRFKLLLFLFSVQLLFFSSL